MGSNSRRRPALWVGLGLVVAGLGLIGYVGWQFFGTNVISGRHQREAVEQLRERWQDEAPDTTIGGAAGEPVAPGDATALIRVPRFGDDYVMPVIEGVADDALARGFGHFEGTARPGGRGNFALAGHRVTHGEPLRDMPLLQPGDEVLVETRKRVFTYVLDTDPDDLTVTFRDVWVIAPRPVNPDPDGVTAADHPRLITLTTCSEIFHTDNRSVAFGHLVDAERKQRS